MLLEDWDSILITHVGSNNYLPITLVPRDPTTFFALWASDKHVVRRHTCTQNTHTHENKSNLIKNETALCCELHDDLHFPVSGELVAPFSSPQPLHPLLRGD